VRKRLHHGFWLWRRVQAAEGERPEPDPRHLNGPIEVLVPALWRNTPGGLSSLVSDYLSSLLPHYPKERESPAESSLGRRWFARNLVQDVPKDHAEIVRATEPSGDLTPLQEKLMRLSYEADLE